ncbi:MAG: 3-phosphoshikimate 1-carboxyvinyltransferase [Bryobacteraceae bacterium]|nr:3-phosphoshikimate 1-carboxyvinyltransferase [Bryobacteraceae bacterium]
MQKTVSPARHVSGSIRLPGDKSISHRYGMLASLAEGESTLENYSTGQDCHSTLGCFSAMGIPVHKDGTTIRVSGQGLDGLRAPTQDLDAGNSGSTIRMISGILAAQPFTSRIGGDESLSKRPMGRIMKPLAKMGARVTARDAQYPPLEITGGPLQPIDFTLPVASAQVKSCVLFGGLYASGVTTVREGIRTRDHSEIALRQFGAEISIKPGVVALTGRPTLAAQKLTIPGDLSSAAFFLVAALLADDADLVLQGVGLNPTRAALLDFLVSLGAPIKVLDLNHNGGEPIGDLRVTKGRMQGGLLEGAMTAALIDEIPVLAVLGAARGGLEVRDASELRVKETDRIATLAENFARMGVEIEVRPDGFRVEGGQRFRPATLDSFHDHRIAMAFAIAALAADGDCQIDRAEAASVSFPEFYQFLGEITR